MGLAVCCHCLLSGLMPCGAGFAVVQDMFVFKAAAFLSGACYVGRQPIQLCAGLLTQSLRYTGASPATPNAGHVLNITMADTCARQRYFAGQSGWVSSESTCELHHMRPTGVDCMCGTASRSQKHTGG
jgi:hypothetical protein